ncbi:MAG: hypothetical protein OXE86_08060 [Alphaproteobacteria bacterium]|nr:hypothetical protein [Alphaproteobacteria bacterium]
MMTTTGKHIWPILMGMGSITLGVTAVIAALAAWSGAPQAGDKPKLSLSTNEARPGVSIVVQGSGFRTGTEASFIYTSTITIVGVPIGSVASVDAASANLHAARATDSGTCIAEHIDIDPEGTTADGAFTAEIVLPDYLSAGEHDLTVISCWGGPDDAYPEDGVAPCGTKGLGGGVNDRAATASIAIMAQ